MGALSAGVALIYWPAGLISGGVLLIFLAQGMAVDDEQ
jgi:hypothetical protein